MTISKIKLNLIKIIILVIALLFPTLYARATSIGTNVSVTGTLTVTDTSTFTGATTFNGNVTVGNSATADTLTVTARLAADLDPNANNTIDLGAFGLAYNNIFVSSTAYLNYTSSTAVDLSNILTLVSTTNSNTGVIYKGDDRFIHTFSHPTGDSAVPDGENLFIGKLAGNFTLGSTATGATDASHNVGIGKETLNALTIGLANVAIGNLALKANTIGNSNTGLGGAALSSNTTGVNNTAAGYLSLYINTTGVDNTAVGYSANVWSTNASYNTSVGSEAQLATFGAPLNGNYNTAVGYRALFTNRVHSNTAVGALALYGITTAATNTAFGFEAGRYIANGSTANALSSTSLYIGALTKASISGAYNENVIGYEATGIGNNTMVLGNENVTRVANQINNNADLGGYGYAWKNIFSSSTAYLGSVTTTQITPWANNTSDFGAFGAAYRDIYVSSTAFVGDLSDLLYVDKPNSRIGISSSSPSAILSIGTANTTSTLDVPQLCFRTTVDVGGTDQQVYYWPCVGNACPTVAMAAAGWATSTASCF